MKYLIHETILDFFLEIEVGSSQFHEQANIDRKASFTCQFGKYLNSSDFKIKFHEKTLRTVS